MSDPRIICDRFCRENYGQPFKSAWTARFESVEPMSPGTAPHYCTRLHTPRRTLDFPYSVEPAIVHEPRSCQHHVLVLQTAPRPQESLSATYESLVKAGVESWDGPRILVSDGSASISLPGWHKYEAFKSAGSAVAFVRMLRFALALDPQLEQLTFLEDDIVVSRNALGYMARVTIPRDVAFVTWFTYDYDFSFSEKHFQSPAHPSEYGTPVLAVRPARFFILTQACTFTRETVDRLLACPRITEEWPKKDAHDEMIAWALGDALYAAHFPILVQHAGGLNSAVLLAQGNEVVKQGDPQAGQRTSPYFKGEDFDALSLIGGSPFTART